MRPDIGEIDRDDVSEENRDYRGVPGKARADDRDVDAIPGGAEEVPAVAERVGGQRDHILALRHQIGQVMREVIGDRDRHQRRRKTLRDLCRRAAGGARHRGADRQIGGEEEGRPGNAQRRRDEGRSGDERRDGGGEQDSGHGGRSGRSGRRRCGHRLRRSSTSTRTARKPSRQVIFLPSAYVRP